jgi:hypothetical protein
MIRRSHILTLAIVFIISALGIAAVRAVPQVSVLSLESHSEDLWSTSGHADENAEAFTHWDEDGQIPVECAKCHSTEGFVDFIGDGVVNASVLPGGTVECEACHTDPENGAVRVHTSVEFPSGELVEDLGPEALCIECHQGRESKKSVDDAIVTAGVSDEDMVSSDLSFINIHYYAAAASQFGTIAEGGYEYDDKSYDARFSHVIGYNACIACHNPHSLDININNCNTCHTGVTDPRDIRFYGSFVDYDGDGDMVEGVYYEIKTLKAKLYYGIKKYARDVIGFPIVYDPDSYPYFFFDTNGNGSPDENEIDYSNQFNFFTPRLLKAAYNYQMVQKDPAGFAHGGKYLIELIFDSISDLNEALVNPISLAGMHRTDEGHFDGSAEAWRHWDEEGEVESSCAKCHSAEGLPNFLISSQMESIENTLGIGGGFFHSLQNSDPEAAEISNGLLCTTCHTTPPNLRSVGPVEFPSGVARDLGDSSNICLICHQGRASKYTVLAALSAEGPYSFINIHYYPAAAVLFGSEVSAGFEYSGKGYNGQNLFPNHEGKLDTCVECHMASETKGQQDVPSTDWNHNVMTPNPADCVNCHGQDISQPNPGADPTKFEFDEIRPGNMPDFDGDGNLWESLKDEIHGLEAELYNRIQIYAAKIIGVPIVYDSQSYPYFFVDSDGDGEVDPGENIFPNGYTSFNGKLLKAVYNYHFSQKEPHAFIHNVRYMAQLLVDSIIDLGGDQKYTWR